MTEDEDIDAPTIEELKTLATLLWDFHPRTRLKGKKEEALRELSEIRDQIDNGSLSATERVRLGNRLGALNGTSFSGPGPLGVGQFVWRPNRRPKGAPSKTVDAELDCRLIQRAKELLPLKKTVGAALRAAIEEVREGGKLVYVETESQIKRLRRKARRPWIADGVALTAYFMSLDDSGIMNMVANHRNSVEPTCHAFPRLFAPKVDSPFASMKRALWREFPAAQFIS
jgi:hypothetical protein